MDLGIGSYATYCIFRIGESTREANPPGAKLMGIMILTLRSRSFSFGSVEVRGGELSRRGNE